MGKIVGIDFGLKRIGLAISDERKSFALPLEPVSGHKDPSISSQTIKKVLEEKGPIEQIVVGLPLHLSGKESELSELARLFATTLEKTTEIPVVLFDERLTSRLADNMLKEKGLNRKKRKTQVDSLSATLILQGFLDRLNL